MLTDSMKWRKEFGIYQVNDNYFPREFYASGAMFSYCDHRYEYNTLCLRAKMIKKIPEMNVYLKK